MPTETDTTTSLRDAVVNGSFPQSEQLLTADLSSEIISTLLTQISHTQQELSDEIRAGSKDEGGNVDEWILQAKKVQEDIARCKLESRRIVEEHQQLQAMRDQATDYQRKVDLLEAEINFTNTLKTKMETLSQASRSLREVDESLANSDPCQAAAKLQELKGKFANKSKSRTAILVRDLQDELQLKARFQLETKLNQHIVVRRDQGGGRLELLPNELENNQANSEALLQALNMLEGGQDSLEPLTDKLRSFIIQPLRRSVHLKLSAYTVEPHALGIERAPTLPAIDLVLDFVLDFIEFLRNSFSHTIQTATSKALLPDLMDVLVLDWLNPELPLDLGKLDNLDGLEQKVTVILDKLSALQWEGQDQLQQWIGGVQRAWLNKRKGATLDAVRKAFASAQGHLRQVERVERQIVSSATEEPVAEGEADDWDANWDEDNKEITTPEDSAQPTDGEQDDTDGWGFDDDEDEKKAEEKQDAQNGNAAHHDDEDDDAGEAWGWGDENPTEKKPQSAVTDSPKPVNGTKASQPTEQEMTLREVYSISEIPDHLIEIIGRDISDAQTIQETQHKSLDSAVVSRGLLALPTLALAMFRATAPSYYGASPSLTDTHRYNDSLYLTERLREMNIPTDMPSIEGDIRAMEKFAKAAYSKEMETQRLIIWDLLEGAQGFTSCTQFPYSQEIENAVSSVVDRLRALYAEWKPVLSTSALMQSLGSLVGMVITKVISSVEEMDDISEPESQRLTAFCQQIATLEDLFLSTPPTAAISSEQTAEEEAAIPMTAVYVSNWLRFQYLINILESSLVDIKYLWTEGELSLEFSADEVVDLIKALFAESAHRRGAIAAIKGARTSQASRT